MPIGSVISERDIRDLRVAGWTVLRDPIRVVRLLRDTGAST
jgi:hypothetical protein